MLNYTTGTLVLSVLLIWLGWEAGISEANENNHQLIPPHASWKCRAKSQPQPAGWGQLEFDDSRWLVKPAL